MAEPVTTATREAADPRLAGLQRLAIVPAYNEADAIEAVINELRSVDPDLEIVVIDDGSTDGTAARAEKLGADVVRLPFNLGIGGAMQTGYQYARDHGFELAIQVDGDGQHDPGEIAALIEPSSAVRRIWPSGRASPAAGATGLPSPAASGSRVFARIVSLIVRQRVTDTTSGFRAVNRLRHRAVRGRLPARLPRGRDDRARAPAPAAHGRGAGARCARARPADPRSRSSSRSTT